MATKREIKEAFVTRAESIIKDVDDDAVVVVNEVEIEEILPAIVYETIPVNDPYDSGVRRRKIEENKEGDTIHTYLDYNAIEFELSTIARTQEKADLLTERLVRGFNRFDADKKPSELAEDVERVTVDENETLLPDREEVIRGERITVRVEYQRQQIVNVSQ
jgi:hypothetical protein